MVIVNFIKDKEVGMFARAKRLGKGRPIDAPPGINVTSLCTGADKANGSGVIDTSEEESDKCE